MPRKNVPRAAAVMPEPSLAVSLEEVEESGEELRVECIEGIRKSEGMIQYWVHWLNFDEKDNTWEPIENLTNCHDQVQAFHQLCEEHMRLLGSTMRAPMKTIRSSDDGEGAFTRKAKKVNCTGQLDEEDGGPRDSVSSSISNQNGRKGRTKGKTTKAKTITESFPPPLNTESDDEELPLAGQRSRSISDSHRSRSRSGAVVQKALDSQLVKSAPVKAAKAAAVKNKREEALKAEPSVTKITPARRAASQRAQPAKQAKVQLDLSEDDEPAKEEPKGRNRRTQSTTKQEAEPQPKKAKTTVKKEAATTSKLETSEDEEEEEVPEGLYAVDAILGTLIANDGKKFYLVKWYNYPLADSTWEDGKAVAQSRTAITEFAKKYGKPTKHNNWKVLSPEGVECEKINEGK